MLTIVEKTTTYLPWEKPRYLMGVGSPEDLLEGVARGIDLFDSALPTRVARNGALFTLQGRPNIQNANYKRWDAPIDAECDCYTCHTFSAAYLHHLFKSEELLGYRLATIHNLRFITRLMQQIRQAILEETFTTFKKEFLTRYQPTDEEMRLSQKQRWLESQT
jgi:queuine tRNA-ribosyltransferase